MILYIYNVSMLRSINVCQDISIIEMHTFPIMYVYWSSAEWSDDAKRHWNSEGNSFGFKS